MTTTTNFEKVKEFNRAFDLPIPETIQPRIFVENEKLVQLKLDLIVEEVEELKDAIRNRDILEVIDALTDILYVTYGAGIAFGIDMDRAFSLVHKSNMSKLAVSEEDAQRTVSWYKNNAHLHPYDSPSYVPNQTGTHYIIRNENSGKILKNLDYTPFRARVLLQEEE